MGDSNFFNFVVMRQPVGSNSTAGTIFTGGGPLAQALRNAADSDQGNSLAQAFLASDDFVAATDSVLEKIEDVHLDLVSGRAAPTRDLSDSKQDILEALQPIEARLTDTWLALAIVDPDSDHKILIGNALRLLDGVRTGRDAFDQSILAPDLDLGSAAVDAPSRQALTFEPADVETVKGGGKRMRDDWVLALSDREFAVLADAGLDPQALDPISVKMVGQQHRRSQTKTGAQHAGGGKFQGPGGTLIALEEEDKDESLPPKATPTLPIQWSALPNAMSLRFGELNVIRKTGLTYSLGEVAHIENVLPKENRKRHHRSLQLSERSTFVEQESSEETEHNLETTDRFELETESSQLTRAELGLEIGGKVSASYGKTYSVEASSKLEASALVENYKSKTVGYAEEVVEKTIERVKSRRRTEQRQRVLNEVEISNEHGFENDTDQSITGIYRWIDKTHDLQVVTYGKRMFVEFQIPDPARVYLEMIRYDADFEGLSEPTPMPNNLNQIIKPETDSYLRWVQEYGAEGVAARPHPTTTVSHTVNFNADTKTSEVFSSETIVLGLPPGYAAKAAHVTVEWLQVIEPTKAADGNGGVVDPVDHPPMARIGVGRHVMEFRTSSYGVDARKFDWEKSKDLDGETESLPIGLVGFFYGAGSITIEIECTLTQAAYNSWVIDTIAALRAAYDQRLAEYRDRVALLELKAQAGELDRLAAFDTQSRIENELRRGCVEFMMVQRLGLLDGYSADPIPSLISGGFLDVASQSNTDRLAEPVQFFEQSFEWAEMSYDFHPYFWSPRRHWIEKLSAKIEDPLQREFIRAGSAKVRLPVVPGQESEVIYLLQTGRFWRGSGPVDLADQITLPLLAVWEELQRDPPRTDQPETLVGDPWSVTVPTSLVMLNNGVDLPDLVEGPSAE